MNTKKFFGNYRIATAPEGTPVELAREVSVVTYKGEHVATHEPVTLMLIPQEAVEPASREQFESELQAAQLLDHPNIAAVRQFQADGNLFVCASDYFEGKTLHDWVDEHGAMPPDAALRIGSQVVSALAAAAFHAVPHGALKPSNIMIVPGTTPSGEWPLVKVLNFGLSRVRPYLPGSTVPTGPQRSPDFSSPEHLVQGEVDFRSDIYSLGAMLWFLVSGAAPVSAAAVEGSTGIHKDFRALIAQMLSVSPTERPQDPVVLEQQLRDCLEQLQRRQAFPSKLGLPATVVVPPPVPGESPAVARAARPQFAVSKRALAIAALLLTLVVLGATMLSRSGNVAGEPKPIGVPIGVPDESTTGPRVAESQPERAAPAEEPLVDPAEAAPATTNSSTNIMAAAPARPEQPVATPRAAIAPQIAAAAAAPEDVIASAPKQVAPAASAAAEASGTPEPPPTVAARNTTRSSSMAEEAPAPAEAPDLVDGPVPAQAGSENTVAEATPVTVRRSAAEEDTGSGPVAASDATAPSVSERAMQRKTASTTSRSRSSANDRQERRTASRDTLPVRRALPPGDEEAGLPALPRGSKRARYLGTDENGTMVFGMASSNEPVYVAPPSADGRRLSPRQRLRRSLFGRDAEVRPAEPVEEFYEE